MKKTLIIHPDELSETWVDRMVRLGVNTISLHPVGGTVAHRSLEELLELLKTKEFRAKIDYAKSQGLDFEYEMHAASFLLPRALYEKHPEYFRIDKDGNRTKQFNFCVSNAEALDIVATRAAELMDSLYGSTNDYYFWLDDGKESYCHCEKCQKFSPSDLQMTVLNAMLAKMRQKNKNARLAYLAYFETTEPPKAVQPAEGIFMEYAPYMRDMTQPVSAMPQADLEKLDRLIAFFGADKSRVLDYWYDNSWFSEYKKPPAALTVNNNLIRQDIAFYKAKGIRDFAAFACYLGADYEALHGVPDLSVFSEITD